MAAAHYDTNGPLVVQPGSLICRALVLSISRVKEREEELEKKCLERKENSTLSGTLRVEFESVN